MFPGFGPINTGGGALTPDLSANSQTGDQFSDFRAGFGGININNGISPTVLIGGVVLTVLFVVVSRA